MKLFGIFFLSLFQCASFAQNPPTKSQIMRIIKNSVQQESKNNTSIESDFWSICNTNNEFYKKDTLVVFNGKSYSSCLECCELVRFAFYKKDAFILSKTHLCDEPTTTDVSSSDDWFTIRFLNAKPYVILETMNNNQVTDRFKVISVKSVKNEKTTNRKPFSFLLLRDN